jgi:hypothetical protein
MSLLDLQQKEDSLKEAIFSNDQALAAQEQAEETEAQSQILFLFTIVTIVFVSSCQSFSLLVTYCLTVMLTDLASPVFLYFLLRYERR